MHALPISALQLTSARTFFWSSKPKTDDSTTLASAQDAVVAPIPPVPSSSAATPITSPTLSEAPLNAEQLSSIAANPSTTPSFITDPSLLDAGLQPAITSISKIGDMSTLGLAHNGPTGWAQSLLEAVYVSTGLPWWATIMVATIMIRIALTPLTLRVQRTAAKMHNISHVTKPLQDEMQKHKAAGNMVQVQATWKKLQAEHKKADVNPFGGLWALVQAPVFMAFFFGLKAMAELPVPGFQTGGLAWFTDLTLADPTYVLPVLANLGMLAVMEFGADVAGQQAKGMKMFMRFALLVSVFVTAYLPSAIFMYWISTNLFSLLQALALKRPAMRRLCNIPMMNSSIIVPPKSISSVSKLPIGDSMKMVKLAAEQRQKRAEASAQAATRITQANNNRRVR
ncbi:hypothetical protein PhCBS80983_g00461 [Powellomyces hirtus]|uniref:Membrane insertase YidC/Oxa/ALB C-terminal domain-containing protein n=1 Tax=Powellomyces hirtus TaxID=109895 RepID=A0A507EEW1_9FUNG|nr:hypothetical protein PhCBS80983_g00461 [Powellomyces hirtus]